MAGMNPGLYDLRDATDSLVTPAADTTSDLYNLRTTEEQAKPQLELPAPAPPAPDLFSLRGTEDQVPPQEVERQKKREETGFADLAIGSVHRGLQSYAAIPDSFRAIGADLSGDQVAAAEYAKSAKAIEDIAPESLWSLSDIRNPMDFGSWLTERLGENAVNILAAAATGGVGAITGSLAARGLGLSKVARASLMKGLGAGGVFASTMPIETSSTVGEQFEATGSPQAAVSLTAGTIKGALELIVPMHIGYALSTPGKQLGKTIPGAIAKVGGEEAATELAQEEVDIVARKYTDPSYEYFGGPALWRRAESGTAGLFVGLAMGGPSAVIEARQENAKAKAKVPDESGMVPGERRFVAPTAPAPVQEARVRVQGTVQDVTPQAASEAAPIETPTIPPGTPPAPPAPPAAPIAPVAPTEEVPAPEMIAPSKPEGVTFDTESDGPTQTTVKIKGPDGSEIGEAYVRKLRGPPDGAPVALQVGNIAIDEAWQRKGIGTALQEELEQKYGLPMVPDQTLSKEAYARWKQIDPEAVAGYTAMRDGESYYAPMGKREWYPGAPDTPRMARVRKAFAAQEYSREVSRGVGPVTTLRNMVMPVPEQDFDLKQAATNGPEQDLMGIGPLLRSGMPQVTTQDMLDMLEAQTPRYAVKLSPDGVYGDKLMNNTDLQLVLATGMAQSVKPEVVQISQGGLQPLGISADVFDLPTPGNSRVWFLPQVSAEEQALLGMEYKDLQKQAELGQRTRLKSVADYLQEKKQLETWYNVLLTRGLRVVPSRGASFYYNTVLDGRTLTKKEVADSGRTAAITFMDVKTGVLTNSTYLDSSSLSDPGTQYLPVALDLNKFKPGEVSALPYSGGGGASSFNWRFKPGTTAEEKARLIAKALETIPMKNEWTEGDIAKFRALMKEGIWLQVYPFSGQIVTAEPITHNQLTYGISPIRLEQTAYSLFERSQSRHTQERLPLPTTTVTTEKSAFPTEALQAAFVSNHVENVVPLVDQLLKAAGMDGGLNIQVKFPPVGQAHVLGSANINKGELTIYVTHSNVEGGANRIFQTIMHEVGHFIAYYHYARLPAIVQQQMYYAYQKALLVSRTMTQRTTEARIGPMDSPGEYSGNINYFTSYVEWIAEQFRRWSIATPESKTFLDNEYYKIAQAMNKFYVQWEELGGKYALDITQPDYFFSLVMEYLRQFSKERAEATQKMKQQTIYSLNQDLLDSPVMLSVTQAIQHALQSMAGIVPKDTLIKVNPKLDATIAPVARGAVARYMYFENQNLNFMELAVGALKSEEAYGETRVRVAHELVHAYRRIGLLTDVAFEQLYRFAKKDGVDLGTIAKTDLREEVEKFVAAQNMPQDKATRDRVYEEWLKEEIVAYYIGDYANTGVATGEAKSLLDYFLQVLSRIRNFIQGLGFKTREDLLRAFFNGEMLEREDRRAEEQQLVQDVANYKSELHDKGMIFNKVQMDGPNFVATAYSGRNGINSKDVKYYWYTQNPTVGKGARPIGVLFAKNRMPKGFDIDWIESTRLGLAPRMISYMEKDLGVKAKPSGTFTAQGYELGKLRFPELLKYYVQNPVNKDYYSPNEIQRQLRVERSTLALLQQRGELSPIEQVRFDWTIAVFSKMASKVQKGVFSNRELLNQMFMLDRNYEKDEVQGSLMLSGAEAQNNKLSGIVGNYTGPTVEPFEAVTDKLNKLEAAKHDGIAPQVEARYMRRILERVQHLESSPEVKKHLKVSVISDEADRIGYFTRVYWGLHQLVWRNEHIPGLLDYMQDTELFNQTLSRWHSRADEIARAWDSSDANRDGISSMMFWLAEMQYRSAVEVAGKIVRMPTQYEREMQARKLKLSPGDIALVRQVEKEFSDFITEVEQVSIDNIRDTVSDPVAASLAILEVQAEIAALRKKPYFPITRFGKFSITARDGLNSKKVDAFYTFDTYRQLQDEIANIARVHPTSDLFEGRVPEEMFEFMGLPAPLIRIIRTEMPGLTPSQQAWLEDFERINLPDKTFRKRWLPARGTPGYSMDGFRVYAHYFMHGSRYLARLKFARKMSADISTVRATTDQLPSSLKRRLIVDYMTKHYNYIMESGKDWSKFKAFVALWQLGFSPATAAINLTQIPVVTLPHLAGTFGNGQAMVELGRAISKLSKSRGTNPGGTGKFFEAWEEMKQQGRISIGQAAELGSYAQGHNLGKLLGGTKVQKFYRNAAYYGMWMFQKAEEANRKVTFTAAWELAMKNPGTKRLQEIQGTAATSHPGSGYNREIADLMARKGFSHQEAVAFIFTKGVIDQTQGIYAPYSRPAFMRKPLAGALLIFYQFTQMMTYVFRYSPGTVQLLLITAMLYGLGGLPGSDDLNELLKLLGKKLFGADWDLQQHARKFARELTRGTLFDEEGPDLLLHGVSRYGFGLGLLPEGWALGKFDASANGSLGKLVPGMYEMLHGINTKQKPDQFVSDTMQRMSGAGFGFMFNFIQWGMENPGTTDSHKWESMLPRSARAVAKAYRLYSDEGETTRQGARIVKFDVQEPEDLAAIATQALGFSATKNTAKWEMLREQRDQLQLYTAERAILYAQMDRAVRSGNPGVVQDVLKSVRLYNEDVKQVDPSMQIQAKLMLQSVQQRIRGRAMQELGLPTQKGQIPVTKRMQDMFPNVEAERVRTERRLLGQ